MRGGYSPKLYRDYVPIDATQTDALTIKGIVNGSRALRKAIETGYGPHTFLWTENPGGANWKPTGASQTWQYRAINSQAEKQWALDNAVQRDPCGFCGTRADIGCKHTGAL